MIPIWFLWITINDAKLLFRQQFWFLLCSFQIIFIFLKLFFSRLNVQKNCQFNWFFMNCKNKLEIQSIQRLWWLNDVLTICSLIFWNICRIVIDLFYAFIIDWINFILQSTFFLIWQSFGDDSGVLKHNRFLYLLNIKHLFSNNSWIEKLQTKWTTNNHNNINWITFISAKFPYIENKNIYSYFVLSFYLFSRRILQIFDCFVLGDQC